MRHRLPQRRRVHSRHSRARPRELEVVVDGERSPLTTLRAPLVCLQSRLTLKASCVGSREAEKAVAYERQQRGRQRQRCKSAAEEKAAENAVAAELEAVEKVALTAAVKVAAAVFSRRQVSTTPRRRAALITWQAAPNFPHLPTVAPMFAGNIWKSLQMH
jgi:hypothetical protein